MVDMIRTPGAATSTSRPVLLELARVSSRPTLVEVPLPPVQPSVSTKFETVVTSSYVAGTMVLASTPALPAATTMVTPPALAPQMALCSGVLVGRFSTPAEAHVDDRDALRGGILGDPVESTDCPGPLAAARVAQHLDVVEGRAGHDADDTAAIIESADDAGHVGAMPVDVTVPLILGC